MTRRKDAKTGTKPNVEEALQELFADSDNTVHFDFSSIEYAPFGRILTAITAMGGMVSVYSGDGGNGVVLSLRVGERKKRYEFADTEEWNAFIEQISNPWWTAYGRWLASMKADAVLAEQSEPKGKGK